MLGKIKEWDWEDTDIMDPMSKEGGLTYQYSKEDANRERATSHCNDGLAAVNANWEVLHWSRDQCNLTVTMVSQT